MKKYIQPEMTIVNVTFEGVIAASIVIDPNQSGDQQLSNEKTDMWGNSNMWGK